MQTRPGSTLFALTIKTDLAFSALVESGLELLGLEFVSWTDVDAQCVVFRRFMESEAGARRLAATLRRQLAGWAEGEVWEVSVEPLAPQDWRESWKAHFKTERVSTRVVIKPTWETFRAKAGDCVVELDPGLSFGTGQHFTTRSCLGFIDDLAARGGGGAFLDLGCGSGILAIAAAKLGFSPVEAVDNDATAVAIARENCVRNGVATRVRCAVADASHAGRSGRYCVVVANILASVLIGAAPKIARLLAKGPDRFLCVAGILRHQYPEVRAAYERLGFVEDRCVEEGDWKSGCFKRV
jgi:ribosomal protein L11 methyltransferase